MEALTLLSAALQECQIWYIMETIMKKWYYIQSIVCNCVFRNATMPSQCAVKNCGAINDGVFLAKPGFDVKWRQILNLPYRRQT